jgi:CheY-like chemotaxis protein
LPDLSRVKVLVADDSATNQSIMTHMLSRMGAECQVVADGVEALQRLEREDFDIALIDIEMPRLSGIEVIRSIRSNDRLHAKMPIIAVTAYIRRANREAIYAAGADSILSKPLPGTEAVGLAVAAALERSAAATTAATEIGDEVPDLDRAKFDHLLDIAGPEAGHELMERLCTDLRRCEAGLALGLNTEDRASIRAETHVLIALAGAVGAVRLQKLAEALNLSVHRRQDAGRETLGRTCMAQVDRLIAFVTAEHARMRGA